MSRRPSERASEARRASRARAVVALALALGACARGDEPPPIHARGSDGARELGVVELLRPVTPADNFVLRPDESGAVGIDADRHLVYVGSREGTLLALDAVTAEVRWERKLGGPVSGVPVLVTDDVGQTLFVGTDNGELHAIDPETTQERWSYPTDGRIRNGALVLDGVVYLVNSRDQVFALDARTGKWRWQYEQTLQTDFTIDGHAGLALVLPAPGSGNEPQILACFDNGKVAALSADSGDALWLGSVAPTEGGNFADCDTTPIVDAAANAVYVAGQSTGVYALSLTDGAVVWRYPGQGIGSIAEDPGGLLIAMSSLEGIMAIDRRGRSVWRTQLDPGSLGRPVVVGDTLVLTHAEAGLVALDVSTGALLGRIPTGSGMSGTVTYDPATSRVYAISNRGVLVGVRLTDA
jgi:outer membrane protein assembly factor BamB